MNTLSSVPEHSPLVDNDGVIGSAEVTLNDRFSDTEVDRQFEGIVQTLKAPEAELPETKENIPPAEASTGAIEEVKFSELSLRSKLGRVAMRALQGVHRAVSGSSTAIDSPLELTKPARGEDIALPRHRTRPASAEAAKAGVIEKDQPLFRQRAKRFGRAVVGKVLDNRIINGVFALPSMESAYRNPERKKFEE
ncbi:MAG TPA: hypothetical protein VD907_04680 [Verrucomicrobiae bacterium]|nr:hypothetical protein [Verrucomicrobiae bacterium]